MSDSGPLTQAQALDVLRRTCDRAWLDAMLAQPDGAAIIASKLAAFEAASLAVTAQANATMISTAPTGRPGVCTLALQRSDTSASATIPKGYTFITNLGVELTVACDVQVAVGQATVALPLVTTRQIDLVNTAANAFDDILDPGNYPDAVLGTANPPVFVSRSPRALVANRSSNDVSWLDLTNPLLPVVLATVTVGSGPVGVAISPDGTRALVPNYGSANVSWLDLTNPLLPVVLATVTVGVHPIGVAISPDGTRALVANYSSNDVSWLDLTNPLLPVVLATVTVGTGPYGVAISPTASADVFGDFVRCLTYVSSTPITGASSDWLSALGNERGCIRQDGEDGEAYRARVRMIPDAVSPLAIARAVDATATALPERWLAEPFNDGADPNVKLAANLGFFDGFFCDSDFCDDPLGVSLADKQPVANLECSGIRESRAYVRVDLVGQLQEPDGLVLYCDDGFCDDPQWGYPDVHTHPVIQGAEQALLQQMQLKVAGGVNFDVYLENSETLVQQGTLSGTTSAGGTPVITLTPVAGTAWYLREGLLTADMGNRHWAVTGQGIAVRLTLDDGTTLQTPWAQGVVSLRSYELEALGYRGQRVTSIECLGLTLYDLEPPYSMNLIGSFTVNTATL